MGGPWTGTGRGWVGNSGRRTTLAGARGGEDGWGALGAERSCEDAAVERDGWEILGVERSREDAAGGELWSQT